MGICWRPRRLIAFSIETRKDLFEYSSTSMNSLKTYVWQSRLSLFLSPKQRSTIGFGASKVLHAPISRSNSRSSWRLNSQPTILVVFRYINQNWLSFQKLTCRLFSSPPKYQNSFWNVTAQPPKISVPLS